MSKNRASNDNIADGSADLEIAKPAERQKTDREAGIARGKAHNQELHELAQIRKHGGYQRTLPI